MAYGIAFAIAYPCRIGDCLLLLALHVNACTPSTPPHGVEHPEIVPTAIAKEAEPSLVKA